MTYSEITIRDYGKPEYLDGAQMRYAVVTGKCISPQSYVLAYCDDIEIARLIANGLIEQDGVVIIDSFTL